MLAAQRQHLILQELDSAGTVRVAALAALLDVSEMTVRRDIDILDAGGQLLRVHGGAARAGSFSALEPAFVSKSTQELAAKSAIAREALNLLRPGMTLLISGGTTTFELARILPRTMDLTVATNSIMVANALTAAPLGPGDPVRTLILGGERTPSEALVGPLAARALRSLHADVCFMGVHGMDPLAGITSPNLLEAEINSAMISSSDKLIVLADSTKSGLVGLARIAPLTAVSTLITDDRISAGPAGESTARKLRLAVPDLRIVAIPPDPEAPSAPLNTPLPDRRTLPATALKGTNA
ncbi:DeoR/GlpR family DNA-binding transcription regulator [Micrococcaceae bacterium Sec5.7]